ncbi:type II toxin-antitoxin system VapC family toxin [Nitratifractor sp.]
MKLFVDTNIFLDLLLKRGKHHEALLILNAIEKGLFSGTILDITLLNIDYIADKQLKDLRGFLKLINGTFQVVGGDNEMFDEALRLDNEDLEDNMQYICAEKMECDLILSNDKSFYTDAIPVMTGSEFVGSYLK